VNVELIQHDDLNATIKVSIAPADYIPEYEKTIKDYAKKMNVPGFRPGQAPKSMVEKRFGDSMLSDTLNVLLDKAVTAQLKEKELDILGKPLENENAPKFQSFAKDIEYNFMIDLGLSPKFEVNLGELGGMEIIKIDINQKMLDDETKQLQRRFGKNDQVEKAADNDLVYVTLTELDEKGEVLEGGVTKATSIGLEFVKHEPTKQQLLEAKVGEDFVVNIFNLFNDDIAEMHHALDIPEAAVNDLNKNFKANISQIYHMELAAFDQELWDKVFGPGSCDSAESFYEKLKLDLEGYYNSQGRHLFEHALVDKVIETNQLPLPETFLKRWMQREFPDEYNSETIDGKFENEKVGLRWQLIKEKIQKDHDIKVEPEEVKNYMMNEMRMSLVRSGMGNIEMFEGYIQQAVEKSMTEQDKYYSAHQKVMGDKVTRKLGELVTTIETILPPDTFFDTIKKHNEEHHKH